MRFPLAAFLCVGAWACAPTHVVTKERAKAKSPVTKCQGELIPVGMTVLGSTRGRPDFLRPSCARASGPECVVSVDVPVRASLRVGVESDEIDAALSLLARSGDLRDELACADDTPAGDTRHARIDATLEPGRYEIVVDSVNGVTGDFELFVQVDPLPSATEVCRAAKPLPFGIPVMGTTRGESNQFAATCAGGAAGVDVVHTIELARPSRVRIHQQTEFDGSLHVRSSCLDPSTELGCNDDFGDGRASALALSLDAGTYYVITDSYSPAQMGTYSLLVETLDAPLARSLQEVCAEAEVLPIAAGRYELDTLERPSTTSASCGGKDSPDYLFALTVTEPRELRARLEHPELNAVLSVRARCNDEQSELICYENPRIDASERDRRRDIGELRVTLEPGTYFLVVDGRGPDDMGEATLDVSFGPPVPPL